VGKSERERILGKHMVMLGDHVMDIRNMCWKSLTFLDVAQDRVMCWDVMNAVTNLKVP
jgi:hypothetical protein